MRILILSDYSSESPGGAQVIIRLFAESLSRQNFQVFEVNTTFDPNRSSVIHNLLANSNLLRELRSVINPGALLKLQRRIREIKPDAIWVHNVNNYWSWSSLLISKFNARTILTCHELSAISNLKLKKSHFDSNLELVYMSLDMSLPTVLLLKMKHFYLRFLFKQVRAVAIGEICQDVLEANDFRITVRIPNRVEGCTHLDTQSREPDSVLFAGRLIEKGLRETAIGVEQAGMRLFLIGPPELHSEALQYCAAERVEYLGIKPNQELLLLLHKFEIVSLCSQSFDNYPTIGLEAIVHGCKIVTSEVTGLSRLLVRHGIDSTVRVGEIPVFRDIQAIPNELFQSRKLLQEIIDPTVTVDSYLSLFD